MLASGLAWACPGLVDMIPHVSSYEQLLLCCVQKTQLPVAIPACFLLSLTDSYIPPNRSMKKKLHSQEEGESLRATASFIVTPQSLGCRRGLEAGLSAPRFTSIRLCFLSSYHFVIPLCSSVFNSECLARCRHGCMQKQLD